MKSSTNKKRLHILSITVLVLVALIIGFFAGQYYSNHQNSLSDTSSGTGPEICNCPNIPVGTSPAKIAKICPC
jgi:hypothetical protein